jgi:hypothetical protein
LRRRKYNLDDQKLWKQFVDHKYDTCKANIFYSPTVGVSQFFKGMIWAASAAKMGYTWKIGMIMELAGLSSTREVIPAGRVFSR